MFSYLAWKSRPLSLCQIEVTFKESRPFFTDFLPNMVLKKDKKYLTNLKKVLYYFISSMKGFFSKPWGCEEGQNNEQVELWKYDLYANRESIYQHKVERSYMSNIYQRIVCHALLSSIHCSAVLSFSHTHAFPKFVLHRCITMQRGVYINICLLSSTFVYFLDIKTRKNMESSETEIKTYKNREISIGL